MQNGSLPSYFWLVSRDAFFQTSVTSLWFLKNAKIAIRHCFEEYVIFGGPKMDLGGLGARDEIKWAKVHKIEKKLFILSRARRVCESLLWFCVFSCQNPCPLCVFTNFFFCCLRSFPRAYRFRLRGARSDRRADENDKSIRPVRRKHFFPLRELFPCATCSSCVLRRRGLPTAFQKA